MFGVFSVHVVMFFLFFLVLSLFLLVVLSSRFSSRREVEWRRTVKAFSSIRAFHGDIRIRAVPRRSYAPVAIMVVYLAFTEYQSLTRRHAGCPEAIICSVYTAASVAYRWAGVVW